MCGKKDRAFLADVADHVPDFDNLCRLMTELGIVFWEVFFLVPMGRGSVLTGLSASECERLFEVTDLDTGARLEGDGAPRTLDVINPATEAVAGRISLGSRADVDWAVSAAQRAFEAMMQMRKIDIAAIEAALTSSETLMSLHVPTSEYAFVSLLYREATVLSEEHVDETEVDAQIQQIADQMVGEMKRIEGVLGVHDLHVWSITQSMRSLSAHVTTDDIPISASAAIQREIKDIGSR